MTKLSLFFNTIFSPFFLSFASFPLPSPPMSPPPPPPPPSPPPSPPSTLTVPDYQHLQLSGQLFPAAKQTQLSLLSLNLTFVGRSKINLPIGGGGASQLPIQTPAFRTFISASLRQGFSQRRPWYELIDPITSPTPPLFCLLGVFVM